nr:MHC class II antigen beta chain [Ogcocephalus cubifrons]
MASSCLTFVLLFISLHAAGGFINYVLASCVFNSSALEDIEYIYSHHFNRVEYVRFRSSVGRFEGLTEFGVIQAAAWNNDSAELAQRRLEKERVCQHNAEIRYRTILDKSVEPTVRLHAVAPSAGGHPNMLVCSVYGFFPRQISVSWLRDGLKVTSDVTSTDELPDADWLYQVDSTLEYTPRSGETISCEVEHISLKQPLSVNWDPSMPESERNKVAIGVSGLVLGLILSLAGFIYYKKKAGGRILVPTEQSWT